MPRLLGPTAATLLGLLCSLSLPACLSDRAPAPNVDAGAGHGDGGEEGEGEPAEGEGEGEPAEGEGEPAEGEGEGEPAEGEGEPAEGEGEPAEGEGEGQPAEGEGEPAEGEGEGQPAEGEGEPAEGEGEGQPAEGEGEPAEGEGEGEGEPAEGEGEPAEGEGEGEPGEGEGEGQPPACRRDGDCPAGTLCDDADGTCVQCIQDVDCDRGFLCAARACLPGCRADADCPVGERCDTPRRACVACLGDGDCPGGHACRDNVCERRCRRDLDCPQDQVCWAAGGLCVGCLQDGDCPLGHVCEDRACRVGCRDDRDCAQGLRCGAAGQCVECITDEGCPPRMGIGQVCADGACRPGCRADDQCRPGAVCRADELTCGACDAGHPCAPGHACDGSVCRQECGGAAPCDEGGAPLCAADGLCVQCSQAADCLAGEVCDDDGACAVNPVARTVAVWQGVAAAAPLQAAGFNVVQVSQEQVRGGFLDPARHHALVLGRNWGRLSEQDVRAVARYVVGGGGVVTEFDGVVPFFTSHHATSRFSTSAQLGWFAGAVGSGHQRGRNTPVRTIDPGSPVVAGIPNPFSSEGGTQYFLTLYSDDPHLRTVATYRGDGSVNFPDRDFPAIVEARVCDATLVFMPFDWQDAPAEPVLAALVANAARMATGRPDPSMAGFCPAAAAPVPMP